MARLVPSTAQWRDVQHLVIASRKTLVGTPKSHAQNGLGA
jgi:hypothetical protein